MAFSALISIVILTISMPPSAGASKFYPDLITQHGSSCAEKTLFATQYDPFYDWISRSYLVDGFETDNFISIQEAGSAYKKLSAWRDASSSYGGNVLMFNSPEPHVLGGSFYQNPANLIARMTVNWGLSIRICLGSVFNYEGQNMCRITAQIIAVEQAGNITFNTLFSEVNYIGSQMTYLTNWISNAKVPAAVGIDRTVGKKNGKFWYYSNEALSTLCSRLAYYYRADMAAYLGKSYVVCNCVGNVCAQSYNLTVNSGEFQNAGPCKSVNSYWIPLSNGVQLVSYSPKSDAYFFLNSTLDAYTFPKNISKSTVYEMEQLSSCYESWLAKHVDPIADANSLGVACGTSPLIGNYINRSPDLQIAWGVGVVLESVKTAVATGDDCQEGAETVEKVCSAHILEDRQIQGIENLIGNITEMKEVRDFAKMQWDLMASKRHDAYLDIVTAFLAVFTATGAVFSKTLVLVEQFIVGVFQKIFCRCMCSCICARHKDGEIYDAKWVLCFRWLLRFCLLGAVIGNFVYGAWKTLKALKSGPNLGWTQTSEHQATADIAFLLTITSTISVTYVWFTIIVLLCTAVPYFPVVIYLNYYQLKQYPLYHNLLIIPTTY